MTTQELKNNIEKVLGNSIRCLLPSYWWKKLFHSVADRIDEVEMDVNNTLTKSFKEFEGKHPDVADRTFYIIYYGEEQAKQQEKNRVLYRKVYTELIAKSQIQPCYIAAPVIGVYDMHLACVNSQILLESGSIVVPNIYIMGGKKWMDVVIHEDGSTEIRDTLYGSATSITVDSQLSDTSTNPVQNKVITKELYTKGEFIHIPRDNMDVLSDQRKEHNRQVYSKLITCYNSETSIPFPLHVAYSLGHGTLVEMRSIQSGRLDFNNNNTWLFSSAISPIYRYSSSDPVANYRGDSSVFRLYSDGNVTIESTILIHDSEAITAAALNDLNERLRRLEEKINE